MQKTNELFEAGNIYLAAYLIYRGFSIHGLTGYGRQKRIQFDNSPEIQEASKEFFANSEASQLFDCYRKTKDYLFQNGV